ncbi:MAG: elongation factor 4 [Parcubacteria group bacterium]|nr:elongation factor 4 [Parcubacteria group bacterium]
MNREHIRNFSIIAHIDHGKSTLADRLLEWTHTVEARNMQAQYLDQMELERERGITIKMQPVRMVYQARINADLTRIDADGMRINADTDADTRGLIYEDLTYKIRGAVFNVYNRLGPAFKENVYHRALEEGLIKTGLTFEREKVIDVLYDDKKVGVYRPDFIVEDKVIIEIKALPFIGKLERQQIWHYLKGSKYRLALLVNFGGRELYIDRIVMDSIRDNPRRNQRESAFILNLIDTPGHVDFSYEVSRSLAAVEGAILLIDGTKGIQAQTLAHLHQAQKQNLVIIPVINKIDLPNARPDEIEAELTKLLGEVDILRISAKEGTNVDKVIEAVIEKIPPPRLGQTDYGRALVFDSSYDAYKGVIAFVRVFDGVFKSQQKIHFLAPGKEAEILGVGYFKPQLAAQAELVEGEIGYIATGLKDPSLVRVGDTIIALNADLRGFSTRMGADDSIRDNQRMDQRASAFQALPGYEEPKPVVFASLFPKDGAEFTVLKDALSKLKLSDAALSFELDSQEILGRGFRCGFLGSLHMEIILERLKREYNLLLVTTSPSVSYEIEHKDGRVKTIFSAAELPSADQFKAVREPWVVLNILTPSKYLGGVMELVSRRRGVYKNTQYLSAERVELIYEIPLSEIIVDFHDKLKSTSSGYGSLSYEFLDMRPGDLVKLDVLVAGELVSALSRIVPRDQASEEGRRLVTKLKELLPREWFKVSLQAAIGGKIVAREDIAALKKDVTGYLYGGDITRKMKLREKQKRGKKKMQSLGRVDIPSEVFFELLKR